MDGRVERRLRQPGWWRHLRQPERRGDGGLAGQCRQHRGPAGQRDHPRRRLHQQRHVAIRSGRHRAAGREPRQHRHAQRTAQPATSGGWCGTERRRTGQWPSLQPVGRLVRQPSRRANPKWQRRGLLGHHAGQRGRDQHQWQRRVVRHRADECGGCTVACRGHLHAQPDRRREQCRRVAGGRQPGSAACRLAHQRRRAANHGGQPHACRRHAGQHRHAGCEWRRDPQCRQRPQQHRYPDRRWRHRDDGGAIGDRRHCRGGRRVDAERRRTEQRRQAACAGWPLARHAERRVHQPGQR